MTENLETFLEFAGNAIHNVSPEQVVISVAGTVATMLAWFGVKISPRLAAAIGSVAYSALCFAGWAAKKREASAACKAVLAALEDPTATYEELLGLTMEGGAAEELRSLSAGGVEVEFDSTGAAKSIVVGGEDLETLLAGGKKGKEWKRIATRAAERRIEIAERDRVAANERAARALEGVRQKSAIANAVAMAKTQGLWPENSGNQSKKNHS